MDLSAFFGVVSTVDFALLGLWWVTVQARPDLRSRRMKTGKAAYLVSLEFVIPGSASLAAQVAPDLQMVWRVAFTLLGIVGVIAIIALAPAMSRAGVSGVARALVWLTVPVYGVIILLAVWPGVVDQFNNVALSALQIEALVFCVAIFLSAQTAWAAAMSPDAEEGGAVREELELVPPSIR